MRIRIWLFSVMIASASARPPPASLGAPVALCDLPRDTNAADRKSTWEISGAKSLLVDFLDKNGAHDWTNEFFKAYVVGNKGGSTYDCTVMHSTTCAPPDGCTDEDYYDTRAFFIRMSIAVLYSQLNQLAEGMQQTLDESLAGDINGVIGIFGPPPQNANGPLITVLIGAFVGGAALAGPYWKVGVQMTAMVGVLNVVAGVMNSNPPPTKEDFKDDLENSLGKIYKPYMKALNTTVEGIFAGNFENFPDSIDPVAWIENVFDDGVFLDSSDNDKDTNLLIAGGKKLIKQAFVVQCLKNDNYYLSMRWDIKKEDCTSEREVWASDRCNSIVKSEYGSKMNGFVPETTYSIYGLPSDYLKNMTETYEIDLKAAIKNAIDCKAHGKEVPSGISAIPSFGSFEYPSCFFNFDTKDEDDMGEAPDGPNKSLQNENGYVYGACGVHINEKKPSNDNPFVQLEATLKDSQGTPLTTATFQTAKPTAVVKGRESDKDAVLPYDFYMAASSPADDMGELQFWYSDQYWTSNDDGHKVFPGCQFASKYEKNGVRSGDCGFTCKDPTENPPASATKAHPLPTSVSYKAGWCGVHVHQDRTAYGNDIKYTLDVTVKDDDQNIMIRVTDKTVNEGGTMTIDAGAIPKPLDITAKEDVVTFNYNNKTEWDSDNKKPRADGGHECGFEGKWDSDILGKRRDMDCGFWC